MPPLNLVEAPVMHRPDLVTLKLEGTLDIATLPQFEAALNRLREANKFKVLVDLSLLDYISSSGLGSFLGMVDHFRKAGGDLAFVRLTDRVQKIFKVVGFYRLLTILPGEDEALKHFGEAKPTLSQFLLTPGTNTPHSGEPFDLEVIAADSRGMAFDEFNAEVQLRPSTGIVSPAKIGPFVKGIWRGQVVLTGPGDVQLKAAYGDCGGEAAFVVLETKTPAALPVVVRCPGCSLATEIRAFNVYRCRDCDEIYFVDKWAHAISLKIGHRGTPPPPKTVSLTIPADANLLGALRGFLTTVLREHGYSADVVNDLELAADEAVTNVVEHAYQYDARRSLTVEMQMDRAQVRVLVKDQGEAFAPKSPEVDLDQHIAERRTGGLGVHLIHTMMDSVDYRREEGSNVLILTKKAVPS
jgi:serine/threonine-protein kinase RsbW